MKRMMTNMIRLRVRQLSGRSRFCALVALWISSAGLGLAQQSVPPTFPSAAAATESLFQAVQSKNEQTIATILGGPTDLTSSGDPGQDKVDRELFVEKYKEMHRVRRETDGSVMLYMGAENWPFPIPLKKDAAGQWYFDTKDGAQEILFRRIGKNEMNAIEVMEGLANAQGEYFQQLHDGSTVHQYAQRILSEEGKQNGLYWKVESGQPESPIGPLVAHATATYSIPPKRA